MSNGNLQLKILLIDDDPDFVFIFKQSLSKRGSRHEVIDVRSAEEALDFLRDKADELEIIVLDYILPGMNGIEFLKQVKKENIDVPVIILTARGSEEIAVKALKLGAYDYLVKAPSSFDILTDTLEKVFSRRQLEKQNLELKEKMVRQNAQLAKINRELMYFSKELIKAEKMASLLFFVRGISHELNNPLAGIVGFSELLLNKVNPEDPIREDLEEIRSCAYRIKDIVSKLAKFCGTEKQKKKVIDAHQLIDEVLEFFNPQAEEAGIEVVKSYSLQPIEVNGSMVDLTQAIMSILINAKEAMSGGGTLTISTNVYENEGEISISDTGKGIEPENIDKVFSPFFSSGKGKKVMGMGLAVTYGIIKEHDGEIKVHSTPGKGTTFSIVLPLAN